MVLAVTGSASLAGLTVGLFGVSRFLVSYPIGQITDRFGRNPGILFGQGLALVGTVVTGVAMLMNSALWLTLGMIVFTMGVSAGQQLRVAAADMYPPRMRGLALGFIATGSLVGVALSPLVMVIAEVVSQRTGHTALGLPWLMMPALILAGMALVTFVRPDPKEIGMNLQHYYPDYTPPPKRAAGEAAEFNSWDLIRNVPTRLAILSNCAGQGNMAIVMVLTSLVLSHHGHSLTAITVSHMFHSAGMFAFTIPIGWAADRYGREQVMYPGVAIALVGALFVAFAEGFVSVTLGTFLVGPRLVRGQHRLDGDDRRSGRDPAPRPRHRRERERRGRDGGARRDRDRPAGGMRKPAGRRDRGGADCGGAACGAGVGQGRADAGRPLSLAR